MDQRIEQLLERLKEGKTLTFKIGMSKVAITPSKLEKGEFRISKRDGKQEVTVRIPKNSLLC